MRKPSAAGVVVRVLAIRAMLSGRTSAEALAVRRGRDADPQAEVAAERFLRAEPRPLGDPPERDAARFEHLARGRDALAYQPFVGREPGRLLEAAQERARA